jgi:hypothetical protein
LNDKTPKQMIFETLNNYTSANPQKLSENEILSSYKDNFERIRQKILGENQELRNTLLNLQNNLNRIMNFAKDQFVLTFIL